MKEQNIKKLKSKEIKIQLSELGKLTKKKPTYKFQHEYRLLQEQHIG